MNDIVFNILVDAANNYEQYITNEVHRLRKQEADLLASAIKEKAALPNDYWKDRHHAERLQAAAEALADTLGRIKSEVDSYRHNVALSRAANNGSGG